MGRCCCIVLTTEAVVQGVTRDIAVRDGLVIYLDKPCVWQASRIAYGNLPDLLDRVALKSL